MEKKYKSRVGIGSDEEIEDNLSYVDESSKVCCYKNIFLFIKHYFNQLYF